MSVLPCLSKVLEHVVHHQLSSYLEKNYLKSIQFRFWPQRSTELVCNGLADDIHKNIDNGILMGVIYLDLSKAFDTVSHLYLLSKLLSYGISGNEFTWFENCLTGSSMYATMVTYQKHSQSSELFQEDQFSVQHCFYSIWMTSITVYTILVLSSMLTIQ